MPENRWEPDVVEDGQCERELLVIFDENFKPCED